MSSRYRSTQTLNPYIALADILINLVLILLLFIPLILLVGTRGWDEVLYKKYQLQMEEAVNERFSADQRPVRENRNDASGEQRWVFTKVRMFDSDSSADLPILSQEGKNSLKAFASALNAHRDPKDRIWWRIRVESHVPLSKSRPTLNDEAESLKLTGKRATAVSVFLFEKCGIHPWELTTSGRGYQDLRDRERKSSPQNERIDLLVISPPQRRAATPNVR